MIYIDQCQYARTFLILHCKYFYYPKFIYTVILISLHECVSVFLFYSLYFLAAFGCIMVTLSIYNLVRDKHLESLAVVRRVAARWP